MYKNEIDEILCTILYIRAYASSAKDYENLIIRLQQEMSFQRAIIFKKLRFDL